MSRAGVLKLPNNMCKDCETQLVYKRGSVLQQLTRIDLGPGGLAVGNLAICTQITRFYFCC